MRDNHAHLSRLWVSAQKRERGLNQEQAVDTCLQVALGNLLKAARDGKDLPRTVGMSDEPDRQYLFGTLADGPLKFPMLQYQEMALLLAYGLGAVSSSELVAGQAYRHTITPLAASLETVRDLPTFTAVQQMGSGLLKTVIASLGVDQVTLDIKKGDWVTAEASLKGTGKHQINLVSEDVVGTNGDTSLLLASNGVQGATAAARLASVHEVLFRATGGNAWSGVKCTAASAATPAALTILPPTAGGSAAGTYRVLYVPVESAALKTGTATADPSYDYANNQSTWTDAAAALTAGAQVGRWIRITDGNATGLIARIAANTTTAYTLEGVDIYTAGARSGDAYQVLQFGWLGGTLSGFVSEPGMYITNISVVVGGHWDGASFAGGRALGGDLNSLKWTLANGLQAEFRPGDQDYTSSLLRGQRKQTLTFDRRMTDAVYQAMLDSGVGSPAGQAPTFGLLVRATGPVIAGGYAYQADLVWPRLALKAASPDLDGETWKESAEVAVLSDPTYGPFLAKITNTVATYAA